MATGKAVNANVLDAALDHVIEKVTNIYVISTSLNIESWSVVDGNYLASTSMSSTSGDFGYTFTKAAGAGGGRKLTIPTVADIDIWGNGSAYGVALVDGGAADDAKVLYVTSCTQKPLTSGDKVNVPSWDIQFTDPV